MNWRAEYYRFVGMSYVQVVKRKNVNKSGIWHNNSENVFCRSSIDKHQYKPRVYKCYAQKSTGVISKTPTVIQKHDYVDKVINRVSRSEIHNDHIVNAYCYAHKDGMVVNKYFTGNKYSQLQNDEDSQSCDKNGEFVDATGQSDAVTIQISTHKNPV